MFTGIPTSTSRCEVMCCVRWVLICHVHIYIYILLLYYYYLLVMWISQSSPVLVVHCLIYILTACFYVFCCQVLCFLVVFFDPS